MPATKKPLTAKFAKNIREGREERQGLIASQCKYLLNILLYLS
jgi:hypothetical protein